MPAHSRWCSCWKQRISVCIRTDRDREDLHDGNSWNDKEGGSGADSIDSQLHNKPPGFAKGLRIMERFLVLHADLHGGYLRFAEPDQRQTADPIRHGVWRDLRGGSSSSPHPKLPAEHRLNKRGAKVQKDWQPSTFALRFRKWTNCLAEVTLFSQCTFPKRYRLPNTCLPHFLWLI